MNTEDLLKALNAAPSFIKDVVTDPGTSELVADIGTNHHLHIDTIGTLARLNTEMLLGLVSPSQFMLELGRAGVPDADANAIANELNEKIFKPIHDQLRNTPKKDSMVREPLVSVPAPLAGPAPSSSYRPDTRAELPPMPAEAQLPEREILARPVRAPQEDINPPIIRRSAPVPQPMPIAPPPLAQTPREPSAPMKKEEEPKDALHSVLKAYGVDPYRESPE